VASMSFYLYYLSLLYHASFFPLYKQRTQSNHFLRRGKTHAELTRPHSYRQAHPSRARLS
jgi:hypothetical protein